MRIRIPRKTLKTPNFSYEQRKTPMLPDMALALCFFAFQWVWNAKINYDLNTDHPTQVNDLSIMPRP